MLACRPAVRHLKWEHGVYPSGFLTQAQLIWNSKWVALITPIHLPVDFRQNCWISFVWLDGVVHQKHLATLDVGRCRKNALTLTTLCDVENALAFPFKCVWWKSNPILLKSMCYVFTTPGLIPVHMGVRDGESGGSDSDNLADSDI